MGLAHRALKGPFVTIWPIGLNAGEPHLRAAYGAQRPANGHRMCWHYLLLSHGIPPVAGGSSIGLSATGTT
jgi:hypothetical protein